MELRGPFEGFVENKDLAKSLDVNPGAPILLAPKVDAAVLTLAEQGSIEGEVQVPVVVINGRMTGDVHALERIELAAKARVQGNLHYKVVEMTAGAQLTGRLVHADTVPADTGAHEAAPTDAWATADA